MIRAAAVSAALVAVCAHAANPAQDYALNCMGCHGMYAPNNCPACSPSCSIAPIGDRCRAA